MRQGCIELTLRRHWGALGCKKRSFGAVFEAIGERIGQKTVKLKAKSSKIEQRRVRNRQLATTLRAEQTLLWCGVGGLLLLRDAELAVDPFSGDGESQAVACGIEKGDEFVDGAGRIDAAAEEGDGSIASELQFSERG